MIFQGHRLTRSILNHLREFIMLQEFRNNVAHVSMTPFQLQRMFTNYILVNHCLKLSFCNVFKLATFCTRKFLSSWNVSLPRGTLILLSSTTYREKKKKKNTKKPPSISFYDYWDEACFHRYHRPLKWFIDDIKTLRLVLEYKIQCAKLCLWHIKMK